jgi:outer membrane protein assembly factor BamB
MDLATKKAVYEREFPGAGHVRPLAMDMKSGRVAISLGGAVRLFDTKKRGFAKLAADTPRVSSHSVADPGDGKVYYGSDKAIVALDISTGKAERIAEAPGKVTCVAVGPDGTVYCSVGVDVYAVRK